jgi:hypothetical protein
MIEALYDVENRRCISRTPFWILFQQGENERVDGGANAGTWDSYAGRLWHVREIRYQPVGNGLEVKYRLSGKKLIKHRSKRIHIRRRSGRQAAKLFRRSSPRRIQSEHCRYSGAITVKAIPQPIATTVEKSNPESVS